MASNMERLKQPILYFSKAALAWQLAVGAVIFSIWIFDKEHPHVHLHDFIFFLNYLIAALLISHWLLPRFFYAKKYTLFLLWTMLIIALIILVDELVLEQIFFPDTRGMDFPGIGYTLMEVSPVIVLLVSVKFAHDAHRRTIELEQFKNTFSEGQLQFLKSQINPHFLFNNLNNLYVLALENSPRTPDVILQLSSLMRYMVYESQEKKVPLEKEIKFLKDFVNLQQLQIEDRGSILFKTEGIKSGKFLAPLLLVAVIENSFKHCTSSQSEGINISICINLEGNTLMLDCSNTYNHFQNNDNLTKGIGLENLRKRLQLIYPQNHQLSINQSEELYQVQLTINLAQ